MGVVLVGVCLHVGVVGRGVTSCGCTCGVGRGVTSCGCELTVGSL